MDGSPLCLIFTPYMLADLHAPAPPVAAVLAIHQLPDSVLALVVKPHTDAWRVGRERPTLGRIIRYRGPAAEALRHMVRHPSPANPRKDT